MSLKLMSAVLQTKTTQIKSNNNKISGDNILKQLLQCVQDCQKRYGGKKVLATEFDSCVARLCLSLEAVLLHGYKPLNSTFKQVANTLHLGNDNTAFWPFIKKHLTNHERERYDVLKHIWTDTGKGKAWIRSALNERSLERYFHKFLSNPELLKIHYEEWALLRDDEKSNLLPNMAAGVASILFAININNPELNSTASIRSEITKPKEEPIIKAPIPEKKEKKKKTKVARQFISFDDDDDGGGGEMLSTSNPSSSSSISSDNSSINELQSTTTTINNTVTTITKKPQLQEITEENKIVERKLSIETSGTREKFNTKITGTLTPISKPDVGELTPLSVEIMNNDNDDDENDIIEVPTDISALLTTIENKNKNELDKKQEKIDSLLKENNNLKEQLRKYVSAIKMLQSDDENVEKILDGQLVMPNYKNEAKLYEKKLIQVAEMHAELMDFNVILQTSLLKKEQQIEILKNELEILRGPMPTITLSPGSVHIWIPSAFLTGSGSGAHHVYQIFIRTGTEEWNIYRRYAQFHALHSDLKKFDPIVGTFDFPPKKSIGNKDSSFVEDRRKRLQIYLRRVIGHWPELSNCNNRFLLEQHLAFFKDQTGDQKNKSSIFPSTRNRTSDNYYTGL